MNGILLVDKPAGWTSMDVCAKLRGALHEKRIGHSGTLDPMATGLLAVFLGRATRAVEFAEADEKTYLAGLRLGLDTDTQDITGTVLSEMPAEVSPAALDAALSRFRGEIEQLPPMYSARPFAMSLADASIRPYTASLSFIFSPGCMPRWELPSSRS